MVFFSIDGVINLDFLFLLCRFLLQCFMIVILIQGKWVQYLLPGVSCNAQILVYQPYYLSDPADILQVMTGHTLYLSEMKKIYYKNHGTGPSPPGCCCSWSHECYLSSPFSNAHLRDLLCPVGLTPLPPSSVYVVLVSLLLQFLIDSYYQQCKLQEMLGFHTHSSLASLPAHFYHLMIILVCYPCKDRQSFLCEVYMHEEPKISRQ